MCMWVYCMCVHACIYMLQNVSEWVHMCVHMWMHLCACVLMHASEYVHVSVYTCVYVNEGVCAWANVCMSFAWVDRVRVLCVHAYI